MNITITEGRLPHISAEARPDEIENVANYVWHTVYPAVVKARAAITALDEGLHSSGVEDARTLLDEMVHNLSVLCDHIEGQKDVQREYVRGDR
jgi:hypothetical protein